MVQINIVGGILDSSGYSIHTRELANALSKQTEVRLSTLIPKGAETLLTDRELDMVKRKPDNDEINLIITNPIMWKLHLTQRRNWVFLVFEGDRIPKSFLNECLDDRIEYIFVPSEHTLKAIVNTSTTKENSDKIIEKLKVIPHGVNLDKFYPKEVNKERFTFLMNKGWRHIEDRGGVQYGIKAYLEEFTEKDNTLMILKINTVYGIPNIEDLISQLSPKGRSDLPKIMISIDNLNYDKLIDLYNACDVLVAPSRAEAFNLPCIEAMACGKPVITTNFGGQTDFVNDTNGWIINGELTEVKWEIMYEGIKWLTPSIENLRKSLRIAYMDRNAVLERGRRALETARSYTWSETAKSIKDLI
ncbi:MAG: glycosyltransferase family 4 protein [Bacteroidetes bacterium]|nr:glycosyltransferase family 4 protein [Bacteroidota bacterium]